MTMTLFGECVWCDRSGRLRFKPDTKGEESRPTICEECYYLEKERLRDLREDRQIPPYPREP